MVQLASFIVDFAMTPEEAAHHPRIDVTPHVSAATLISESVAQVAARIRHLEQGLPVTGEVDRNCGY